MAEWDELAGNYAENVQSLAAALRALMREIAPDAEENVHLGWKAVGYCFGSGREALAIGLYKAHVNMILFDGIDLDDPQGLLEGTGKRARHVKVPFRLIKLVTQRGVCTS